MDFRLILFVLFCRKARRKDREGADNANAGDSKLYLESAVLENKLPELDMRLMVDLPPGLDYNEWLASHSKFLLLKKTSHYEFYHIFSAMALFDHVNLVYGAVSEFCTNSGCPDMTGPGQR